MKTDDLIDLLSAGEPITVASSSIKRFVVALLSAALASALLMALFLKVRPDLLSAFGDPMMWVKLGFSAALAAGGILACSRLARPGASTGMSGWLVALPVILIWLVALAVLAQADQADRTELLLGKTWAVCPFLIAGLSIPGLCAFMWAMKGLAPTRPGLAGAAAGLSAGGIGAVIYCLHCPEMTAPFIAIWYLIGILLPAGLGYWLGPRLLRW